MEAEFWLARWRRGETGFHQGCPNPWLLRHWACLKVAPQSPVFVPLCGKSLDMRWLLTQGHQVYGVELAEDAVRGYFEDAGERFDVISGRYAYLDSYVGPGGVIYRGNLFDLTAPDLPGIQAVYDRAALVALPLDLRARYADHLLRIVPDGTRILLVTMEFEQSRVAGPPFAVPSDEVEMLFKDRCRVERLDSGNVYDPPPKFAVAGVEDAQEVVWRITKQH